MVQRILVLLYGVVAYLMFFSVILYMIGFEANAYVPKGIDDGNLSVGVAGAIGINISLLVLFAVQRTIMARRGFKRWFTRFVPTPVERSTFVLLTGLILFLTYWLWQPLGGVVWSVENTFSRALLIGISLTGWAVVFISSFLIDHFELFGLRQSWLYFRGIPDTSPIFVKCSLYHYVRHPLIDRP